MYGTIDRDSPIDLLSMTRYMVDSISIWDILAELVLLTTEPPPANPFDIDHTFLDNLTSAEQVRTEEGAYLIKLIVLVD